MNINPVVWFEIYVQDMDRARKFYETVLKQALSPLKSPIPDTEMWAFQMNQNAPGASGMLVRMKGVKQRKMSIGEYGYITLAFDTEGNMFGLHSM